jgi:hypothetical protein
VEDVESTLAGLEQRLRALQAELDEEASTPAPPPPAGERRAAPPPPPDLRAAPPPPPPPGPAAPTDALERFGRELRRLTAELVAAWAELEAQTGRSPDEAVLSGPVAVDARADLRGLSALDRALSAIPGVSWVQLRAYAGGHAALDVALDRPVALVAELRRAVDLPLTVDEVGPDRLTIAVG